MLCQIDSPIYWHEFIMISIINLLEMKIIDFPCKLFRIIWFSQLNLKFHVWKCLCMYSTRNIFQLTSFQCQCLNILCIAIKWCHLHLSDGRTLLVLKIYNVDWLHMPNHLPFYISYCSQSKHPCKHVSSNRSTVNKFAVFVSKWNFAVSNVELICTQNALQWINNKLNE